MRGLGLYTIHIRELTTTIPDTTTHIQNIPILIVGMDIEMLTVDIHQCHTMSISVFTMG
jgi:hypothetical protein